MAKARLSMRKIKEVLRLSHHCGLSVRQVALSLNISRSTVKEYQQRAEKRVGLALPRHFERSGTGREAFSPCSGGASTGQSAAGL